MSEYTSMPFTLSPEENCRNDTVQMQSINLVCPVCDAGYIDKKEFYNHLHIHAGDVLLKHMQCLKKDENNESESELNDPSPKKIDDNFCETALRPFKCQQCDLTFDRASQYDYHYRSIHLGEKSQLCEICGKGFFRKADLRTHLNIHLGTNVCICEVCGRKFNHISNLIRHCRMHAGVKYPCSICGKRYTQISSLARHKRIHERLQSNFTNGNLEKKDHIMNKNKFIEGSGSSLQKVVKRQHYCKICGESFNFIFLLREHEKSHSQSLERKNNEVDFQKIEEPKENKQQHVNNFDFLENEINAKKAMPLDAIIYITSEQLKKINLENMEDNKNHISQKTLCETKISSNEELDVSEKVAFDSEQTQLVHDNPFLLCKSNNSIERENVAYACQADENVHKNKLCESDLEKSEMISNYNSLINTSLNVTDMFQKMDLSGPDANEHLNSDLNLHKSEESNLVQNEKLCDDLNDVNNIVNHDEPMLRLVQTETGEQFYEFLINNLVEKLPSTQPIKTQENKDESTSIHKENHQEQSIRDDIHSDLNYSQYELPDEEKNYVTNQILLDTQTEFDKYVDTNFEVFERLNYDDSSERFLEFVETTELENQSSKISECSDESEQFLQFQNFSQINAIEENEKNATINDVNNANSNGIVEIDEKQEQNENIVKSNEKLENEQDSKKLKTFLIKFQCTVCEKSFSTSYNYKQHIGTHFADQQKFHCKDCKMSFAWKSTLNKHIANNHRPEGPQKFSCDICKKIYNTSSQVNEHVKRDHLKQRNHVCSQCGKSFFKKYDLKIHNRIHTDERPYVCRACGKRFHHRSHIVRHERIHF
ncbi:unnamed protein product [Xylocopa violacea]|uniref:C2H2-type domain-containing protein n=1 Tax=Xylocopa violacea TaxID=135666 RepID=A0ABP1NH47_XYLVO